LASTDARPVLFLVTRSFSSLQYQHPFHPKDLPETQKTSLKSKSEFVTLEGYLETLCRWARASADGGWRESESVLFGKPYVPPSKGRVSADSEGGDEDILEADVKFTGNTFADLMDSEVRNIHEHWEKSIQFDSGDSYSWYW
jgi:hypothetical protein